MKMMRKSRRLIGVFGTAILFAGASPVSAHATVSSSDPAANAILASSPKEVRITFTESLEATFSGIQVVDTNGRSITSERATIDAALPAVIHLPLQPLKPGLYQVQWTSVARDGHRMKGSYSFTVR